MDDKGLDSENQSRNDASCTYTVCLSSRHHHEQRKRLLLYLLVPRRTRPQPVSGTTTVICCAAFWMGPRPSTTELSSDTCPAAAKKERRHDGTTIKDLVCLQRTFTRTTVVGDTKTSLLILILGTVSVITKRASAN